MTVYKERISLKSHGDRPTYLDITPQVKAAIENSGIKEGVCFVISPHTTCSVFFEEFVHDYNEDGDEFLQEDLNNVLGKIIPDQVALDTYVYPGGRTLCSCRSMAECSRLPSRGRSFRIVEWRCTLKIHDHRIKCNLGCNRW